MHLKSNTLYNEGMLVYFGSQSSRKYIGGYIYKQVSVTYSMYDKDCYSVGAYFCEIYNGNACFHCTPRAVFLCQQLEMALFPAVSGISCRWP